MEVVTHRILRIIYSRQGRIHKEIGKGDYKGICEKGRTGDHMLTNLQCDLCNFQNMKGRYPNRLRQEYNILTRSAFASGPGGRLRYFTCSISLVQDCFFETRNPEKLSDG